MNKILSINDTPKHRLIYERNIIPEHHLKLIIRQYAYEFGVQEYQVNYTIDTEWGELPTWTPMIN